MKLLLTSGGVTNTSIRAALVELLGKPIADSRAVCIPTAMYGRPATCDWVAPSSDGFPMVFQSLLRTGAG